MIVHEVSIAESLLTEAARAGGRHGLRSIRTVGVCVGRLSGVSAEALAQAFEVLRDGWKLNGAVLEVRPVDGSDLRIEWIEGE